MVPLNSQLVGPDATLYDAVRVIERSRRSLAVVVDDSGRLLGTVTDGDIRRGLLGGHRLDAKVTQVMNREPLVGDVNAAEGYLRDLLLRHRLEALPVVDANGRLQSVVHLNDLTNGGSIGTARLSSAIGVIMAGGEGQRLRPLTEGLPKPMIDVGGMPLLERQIRRMAKAGIRQIYISVNYLGHLIQEYFRDGAAFGVAIDYLNETKKLGTAGALSLLSKDLEGPVIVVNGDVLTTSDHVHIVDFHQAQGALMTVAAVEYQIDIPYGVIHASGTKVVGVEEKPSQRMRCNAGIYVLSPETLGLIPYDTRYDMTELIQVCIGRQANVVIFPIHEYWADIGTAGDLMRVRKEITRLECSG